MFQCILNSTNIVNDDPSKYNVKRGIICQQNVRNWKSYERNYCYPCNENQLDALFILNVFRHSTSTCFAHICSQSSGGILCINNTLYVLRFSVDRLLTGPTDSQLKSVTRTSCCIYTVHLPMMCYRYARNMQRLIDEIH